MKPRSTMRWQMRIFYIFFFLLLAIVIFLAVQMFPIFEYYVHHPELLNRLRIEIVPTPTP